MVYLLLQAARHDTIELQRKTVIIGWNFSLQENNGPENGGPNRTFWK
jgi:hypothetical protein